MKKLGDIVLVLAIIVILGAFADLVGLTQFIPKGFGHGVTPGGYLRLGAVLILLDIALAIRGKK